MVRKPDSASLMDFFPEWPWYILVLEMLTVVILAGMTWPFMIERKVEPTPFK